MANGDLYTNIYEVRYRCKCLFVNETGLAVPAVCPIHFEPGVALKGLAIIKKEEECDVSPT